MSTSDPTGTPGKTRTWWHPLLVSVLEHDLLPQFDVRPEVKVGAMPLQADIVLVRRGAADVPERARRSFRILAERLNRWTLIEFKSPVDSLERGDLSRLFGVNFLFLAQQPEAIAASEVSLVILASSSTRPFETEVQFLGLRRAEVEPGVSRIDGGLFTTWLLELDRLPHSDEPALAIFSRAFLRDRQLIMEMVRNPETQPMLRYVFQQIRQFQELGEAFMIQHTHTAEMDQEYAAFKEAFVQSLTPEDLAALSPDERLAGLSPDELLQALTPEQRKRLLELLSRESDTGGE